MLFRARSALLIRTVLAVLSGALVGALLLLAAPVAYAGGDGLVRQEVTFRGGGGLVLHGTVLSKDGASGPGPGIVLVGGSGAGPREEYRQEAEAFARAGITTLVYDKRTVGYSRLHVYFGLLADDALAGVRLLQSRNTVNPRQVGMWGFSEGGWVAPLAASRSADVAFVVTIGGSGYDPLRTQAWNLTTHLRHQGVDGPFRRTVAGATAQFLGSTGLFPEGGYDPVPVLEQLHRTPVLALWGEHDTQVPPQESSRIFRETLARAGNQHAVIGFVAGGAHNGHRTTDGFDRIGGPLFDGKNLGELAPGYAQTMTSWVRAVAAGHPPASSAAPAPGQALTTTPVPSHAWYAWLAPALLLLGFAAYPVSAVLRRGPVLRPVRWLAVFGLLAVVAAVACPLAVFVAGDGTAAPVVWGRPVVWLVVQGLAVAVVVSAGVSAAALWRRRVTPSWALWLRLAPVGLAAVGFVPWAVWWGVAP
ncbi:dienelactone hydrolase/heme exporter protein D [Kitasatospora sp. GP30]|uniref:alpha/beta hydrolase family protein n=1 Tax=Kitasatospora sp. GP30 TaxID=3035084 RepID=UPI000C6FCCEC|nr:prolyl oligopeptidase family serine peptidase [Kitasatospora sp. GP30]MDH6139418.1 dienelactone hydrolase/heme exporter protein D [Kitasatospora sp. GP30]